MTVAGELETRLREAGSLRTILQDLDLARPGSWQEQDYIRYLLGYHDLLPTFLNRCFKICQELRIDPDRELAF